MYQTSTNITQKYCQETHYNYMGNSGFLVSDCSPLLHYHCENHANSYGNAITNSLGFSLFSAFVLSQSLPHKFLRKRLIKILVRENLTTS